MTNQQMPFKGLTSNQARKLSEQYGKNELTVEKKETFLKKLLTIISEPMFMLLIATAVIYFILGEARDGAIMLAFVVGIISIDVIQEFKTDKTLNALKDLTQPRIKVIRDDVETVIASADLVPGDVMIISEGVKIPADGCVLKASDLRVDESSLTGEAEGVWKTSDKAANSDNDYWRKDYCYAGTLVTQGSGYIQVDKIGLNTEYGKIGANVASAPDRPTPLEKQTRSLVKFSAIFAAVLLIAVGLITWANLADHAPKARIIESTLSGITLAMAMIPEEFPVILTVFLSLGAWRLAKKNSLVRRLSSVETLGAVTVLCVDKTGTITKNQMTVTQTWAIDNDELKLCETTGLACETDTYDPMEKAMLAYCEHLGITRQHLFGEELLYEYAFTNELKMMGHVWFHENEIIVAAKGSAEQILKISCLTDEDVRTVDNKIQEMSSKGLRVIGVGMMKPDAADKIPNDILSCSLTFCGLIGLADPPRESVKEDIAQCTKAGIRVVMITGDNGITASSIARQISMPNSDNIITGDELNAMTDSELKERVKKVSIFSRVIPEHKMRIVKALKDTGEVVAMTGDGVNDAPALKYADIGIAMGKRGSEVCREAADLILMDDNFSTIVDTVKDGRRIYDNIRKAVGYVFTIHIPIALASLLAPILGIRPDALLLLPLHVVLLELVIDPTCSIVLERQPAESDIMRRCPRNTKETLLTTKILAKSVAQGLAIFLASFGAYCITLSNYPDNAEISRAMGIIIIIFANLFLVVENSSDKDFMIKSIKRLAKDNIMRIISISTIAVAVIILYTPLNAFLRLAPLSFAQFILAVAIAAVSVFWYEIIKLIKKIKH